MAEENRGTIWVARVAVVEAAEAYIGAWTASSTSELDIEGALAVEATFQDLLTAVRALKERRG